MNSKIAQLKSPHFKALIPLIKQWLIQIGHSQSAVYQIPMLIIDFCAWLENNTIFHYQDIKTKHVDQFIHFLKYRPNKRRKNAIGNAHINKQIYAIKKMANFLNLNDKPTFVISTNYLDRNQLQTPNVLTLKQVKQLYQACDKDLLGHRDQIMLHLFYACGLRRSEGTKLLCQDLSLDTKTLIVQKPKNGKQRIVPLSPAIITDIQNYLFHHRPLLLGQQHTDAFLLSVRGQAIKGQSLCIRLKKLLHKAHIQNNFGLHTLRHSIATHMLHNNIPLHRIAQFLGHQTLDSTQIYTHIKF